MRKLIPTNRRHTLLAAGAVAATALLGTFTHIVTQATVTGPARYHTAALSSATQMGAARITASASRQ